RLSNNHIIEVNEAWTEVTGYSSAEVVGRDIGDLNLWVHPEERGKIINLLSRDGVARGFEFKMRRKSGQISDMLFSGELIELDGKTCMLSMALD
ncbi:PAS domain-containing protein, partial [bacterium]|nr:PAS domain-containing protein [bacterium]